MCNIKVCINIYHRILMRKYLGTNYIKSSSRERPKLRHAHRIIITHLDKSVKELILHAPVCVNIKVKSVI